MRSRLCVSVALLASCTTFARAQAPNWTLTVPQVLYPLGKYVHPFARLGGASVYDTFHAQVTLFGGLVASSNGPLTVNDMWVSVKGLWVQIYPSLLPPARFCAATAYDYNLGQMVVFGGGVFQNNGVIFSLSDTWVWTGTQWYQRFPITSPGARYAPATAFDAVHNQTVMFGGVNSSTYLGDTWVWDGNNWTQKFPAHSPSLRAGSSMVYDATRETTVLFGGVGPDGSFNDTWIWNGSDWTQVFPANQPPVRYAAGFTFDAAENQSILFAGTNEFVGNFSDTWAWDGANWSQQFPAASPPIRFFPMMVYDYAYSKVVLFGGGQGSKIGDIYLGDTWAWN